jgi:transcriptional regulator with XRE-family HTH domain
MGYLGQQRHDEIAHTIIISVSRKIKRERESRGWTVMDLLVESHVNQQTIYNLENMTERNPKMKTLVALADAFGMDVWDFIRPEEVTESNN